MSKKVLVALLALLSLPFVLSARSESKDERPSTRALRALAQDDRELRAALAKAGIATPARPADESADVVALGRTLFFDVRLSGNKNISCSSCHYHRTATTDGRSLAIGEGARGAGRKRVQASGKLLARKAPALYDRGLLGALFWDARIARTEGGLRAPVAIPARFAEQVRTPLAAQALVPPLLAEEMRGAKGTNELADAPSDEAVWAAIMKRLLADEHVAKLFATAFPGTPRAALGFGHAARAIAAFETKQWTALETPLDAFLAGDARALTDKAKRGGLLFAGAARCASCHSGPLLTDEKLHALAVPQIGPGLHDSGDDVGAGDYRFKTPPLRNVAIAGPWMHDGCFTTLEAAVRHHLDARASLADYNSSQLAPELRGSVDRDARRQAARAAALDERLATPVKLSANEVDELLAFLDALSDARQVQNLSYRMGSMMIEDMMPRMMASMWDKNEPRGDQPKGDQPRRNQPLKGMAMPLMMGQ